MNILQISTMDHGGGAAKIPWDLFQAYEVIGHRAMLAIGYHRGKMEKAPGVLEIPNDAFRSPWSRLLYTVPSFLQRNQMRGETRIRNLLIPFAEPRRAKWRARGREDFAYPATERLLDLIPHKPDVIHCHNLHGDYFDLRALTKLSNNIPVILTLHDMWLLTGHCAYSIDCDRWRNGCGNCPDITLYPAISRDGTRDNWLAKRDIFSHSRLHVGAPCKWLGDFAKRSILGALDYRVIPHGIDLGIFHAADREQARLELNWPLDALVILFVGSRASENKYKDYTTITSAVEEVAAKIKGSKVMFVSLGGREDKIIEFQNYELRQYAFRYRQKDVVRFYQAADVFLHAAKADTFPTTVLEALACGVPVIATAVGGIPEQIEDRQTGFLVPTGDASGMAHWTIQLLKDEELRRRMAAAAAAAAIHRFDLRRQVRDYLAWYEEVTA
jgi:glycosyltransferase involved in cell wall biosynthesis